MTLKAEGGRGLCDVPLFVGGGTGGNRGVVA